MNTNEFQRLDLVTSNGMYGIVWKVTDEAVHVKWDGHPSAFQKFFFSPTHHMQSNINELNKINTMEQPKLNDLCVKVFEANKLKGFDVSKENVGQTLMLIVSELSEALEAHRKGRYARVVDYMNGYENHSSEEQKRGGFELHIKDSFEDEIADAAIRIFDLAGGLRIDLDWHIQKKIEYNAGRIYKHGKAY